jgi:hypothetical protein
MLSIRIFINFSFSACKLCGQLADETGLGDGMKRALALATLRRREKLVSPS